MWAFFGGVTPYVVIDNLKSGVKSAHRYDPDINPTYCEYGNHQGFAVLPARPYNSWCNDSCWHLLSDLRGAEHSLELVLPSVRSGRVTRFEAMSCVPRCALAPSGGSSAQ
jgi:hypothetical protein